MTEDRQETQDVEFDTLDKELAEGLQQTESVEQIEQIEDFEPEELVEESEPDEREEQEVEEEPAEPIEPVEEAEEIEPAVEEEETDPAEEPEPADQPDLPQQDRDIEPTVESVVEAVLFASDEPLSAARLANIVETDTKQVREQIKNLNEKYRANNNAFRIEQIAGGFQMLTLSPYNHWLKKLLRVRSDNKLSAAAMETLAIIAYKQPVIRADIEVIRGVAAGEVIRSLAYKGLVKIVGRAEILGRPMLYGTTKKFLEVFGLNTLKDLPKVEELKKPPS
jgi:segregation and condensation protein B